MDKIEYVSDLTGNRIAEVETSIIPPPESKICILGQWYKVGKVINYAIDNASSVFIDERDMVCRITLFKSKRPK